MQKTGQLPCWVDSRVQERQKVTDGTGTSYGLSPCSIKAVKERDSKSLVREVCANTYVHVKVLYTHVQAAQSSVCPRVQMKAEKLTEKEAPGMLTLHTGLPEASLKGFGRDYVCTQVGQGPNATSCPLAYSFLTRFATPVMYHYPTWKMINKLW